MAAFPRRLIRARFVRLPLPTRLSDLPVRELQRRYFRPGECEFCFSVFDIRVNGLHVLEWHRLFALTSQRATTFAWSTAMLGDRLWQWQSTRGSTPGRPTGRAALAS